MYHTIIKVMLCLGLFILLIVGWHYFSIYKYSNTPLVIKTENHQPILFDVAPRISIENLAQHLYQQNVLQDPKKFIQLAQLRNADKHIQAGEYSIPSGITPQDLLTKFIRGDIFLHRFTIIEGWTFKQVMQSLSNNPAVNHTLADNLPQTVMKALGHTNQHPEGLFYPDTYLFKKGTKDVTLLRMSYRYMQKKLNKAWQSRDSKIPYQNAYQVLIAASLIEKESKLNPERPIVARVISNRLEKKMLLQIDAAVIYGLGENYTGKLTRASLSVNTAYNTYMNKGLPPTPIAMPSISAINAVLHPGSSKALYYVAKGDGSHVFSNTLQAHQNAIQKYLLPRKLEQMQLQRFHTSLSLSFPLAMKFWLTLLPKNSLPFSPICYISL
jgi:UPF0755 protein